MNEPMQNTFLKAVLRWLAAPPPCAGQGSDFSIESQWGASPAFVLVLLLAALALVGVIYLRDNHLPSWRVRVGLACLRFAAIGTVVFMLYGWSLRVHCTDLPDIVLVVDDSASMLHVDQYSPQTHKKLLRKLQDLGISSPRRIDVVKALLSPPALQKLQEGRHVRVFRLAASARLQDRQDIQDENLLSTLGRIQIDQENATSQQSALGDGLRDILESQRGRSTAAVVLLTDGITNKGRLISVAAQLARRKAIPLYIVGIGQATPPQDVALADLLVDDIVFVNDLVHFDFQLKQQGFGRRKVEVRLREKGRDEILARETIVLEGEQASEAVRLTHRPPQVGDFEYIVEADVLKGEANAANNLLARRVSVRDETIRLLLIQSQPSWEYQYLKILFGRELKREGESKAVDLTTVLQEADPEIVSVDQTAQRMAPVRREDLFQYDVIIFGDVNPRLLARTTMENIAAFVTERGGGLIVVAGPNFTPLAFRGTPLEDVLPIKLETASPPAPDEPLVEEFVVTPTELGLSRPQMQIGENRADTLRVWADLPGIRWFVATPDLKPGARVLAEHPQRTDARGHRLPLITSHFAGAGKVVFHAFDESYRWRFRRGDIYFARYWTQTIRALRRTRLSGKEQAAELSVDREQYRQGEAVLVRVKFFDERKTPQQDDAVSIIAARQGGVEKKLTLRRVKNDPSRFEAVLPNLARGDYRVWLATPTSNGEPISRRFSVTAPLGESERLAMNQTDLELAAQTSKGRYYTALTAGRMWRALPPGRPVRTSTLPPTPLWNLWPLAALFLLLVISEWLLRKRMGML